MFCSKEGLVVGVNFRKEEYPLFYFHFKISNSIKLKNKTLVFKIYIFCVLEAVKYKKESENFHRDRTHHFDDHLCIEGKK